ncbi:MAG: hypothetical protein ABI405_07515, partial [Parafilimonas sp.]
MTDPLAHINYTFEDIQRYLQGRMSSSEMHDMEKASLQDSFLADAIEGYTNVSETIAKQHLNEINASLFIEKQKSKVVAFHKRTRWLNIAAMLILIAGVGFLSVYIFKNSNKQQELAQVKNQPPETKVLNDSATATTNGLFPKKDTDLFIAENKSSTKEKASAGQLMKRKIIATDEDKIEENISTIAAAPVQQNGAVSG